MVLKNQENIIERKNMKNAIIELGPTESCLIVSSDGSFIGGELSEESEIPEMLNQGATIVSALFILQKSEKYKEEFENLINRVIMEEFRCGEKN